MAQQRTYLKCNFNHALACIDRCVMDGSVSASYEAGWDAETDGVRCAVRVYERYSWLGGNRLSLNITLFGRDGDITLLAVTSGGSQARFIKINTWGEEAFLDRFMQDLRQYNL